MSMGATVNRARIQSLKQTIRILAGELAECITDAQRKCVSETLHLRVRELRAAMGDRTVRVHQ